MPSVCNGAVNLALINFVVLGTDPFYREEGHITGITAEFSAVAERQLLNSRLALRGARQTVRNDVCGTIPLGKTNRSISAKVLQSAGGNQNISVTIHFSAYF